MPCSECGKTINENGTQIFWCPVLEAYLCDRCERRHADGALYGGPKFPPHPDYEEPCDLGVWIQKV